jgi:protein TonB
VHYLHNPAPRYPRTARRNRAQGRVLLRVQVGPDGIPLQIEVQQSSGHLVLDQAALHAVRQWIFGAARDGTEAHGAWVVVPLIFSLKENK